MGGDNDNGFRMVELCYWNGGPILSLYISRQRIVLLEHVLPPTVFAGIFSSQRRPMIVVP